MLYFAFDNKQPISAGANLVIEVLLITIKTMNRKILFFTIVLGFLSFTANGQEPKENCK